MKNKTYANVLGAVHKKRRPTVPSHLSTPSELDHELSSHPEDFQKLFHLCQRIK
jgi:hypothetical protein